MNQGRRNGAAAVSLALLLAACGGSPDLPDATSASTSAGAGPEQQRAAGSASGPAFASALRARGARPRRAADSSQVISTSQPSVEPAEDCSDGRDVASPPAQSRPMDAVQRSSDDDDPAASQVLDLGGAYCGRLAGAYSGSWHAVVDRHGYVAVTGPQGFNGLGVYARSEDDRGTLRGSGSVQDTMFTFEGTIGPDPGGTGLRASGTWTSTSGQSGTWAGLRYRRQPDERIR